MIRALAIAVMLSLYSAGGVAATMPRMIQARPSPSATGLAIGETRIANRAMAYRPASAGAGPLPLIVLLHGAGGYPPRFLQSMERVADQLGVLLLAPRSTGRTWDIVENMAGGDDPWRGADTYRLDQSLRDLFSRAAVDPTRVVLLGFSDGASYALSVGLANPKLFTAIIALSPGMYAPPMRIDRAQRVFIAHGRHDHVLPFARTKDIAAELRSQGADLRFRPFEGDHQMDAPSVTEGLLWALAPAGTPAADLQR